MLRDHLTSSLITALDDRRLHICRPVHTVLDLHLVTRLHDGGFTLSSEH
jgi:hypothetical protein